MTTLFKDIRYSVRSLLKHPGFTAVVVATLAVGIAANTTIFSTVDALLLHPFSFPNQERLLVLWEQNPAVGTVRGSVAPGNFTDWREQNKTCEQLVAIDQLSFDLSDGAHPERFPGYGVTQGFFDALGVKAVRGRTFLPEESEPGREQVVVLKNSFWQERFDGDPKIVGKTITLNRKPFTVVGVMPSDFNYPYNAGVMWTPLIFDRDEQHDRQSHYLRIIGLLKPGATIGQAQAELHAVAKRAQEQFPETNSGRDVGVVTLTDDAVRGARTGVPILMGAVVFVLLIACANVANLLLVRAVARQRETAVRLALGASRARLIRQALTESAILGILGGTIGLFISVWAIEALARGIPEDFSKFIPGWNRLGINLNVLFFTFGVSLLAGMVAGLAPVWHSTRTNLNEALKAGGRGDSGRGGHSRIRSTLVVAEVALSLVLLVGAGLMVRSFIAMQRADLGIKPENVLAMQIALPRDSYEDKNKRRDFYQQLLGRVGSMPGVMNSGVVSIVPFSSSNNSNTFQVVGQPPFTKGAEPYVEIRVTTPGYFDAIGTSLRGGRLFTAQDDAKAARVILVNETFARKYLPGQQPIGQRLELGGEEKEVHEIIGVVADVKNDDLDEAPDPAAYLPYSQNSYLTMNLIIRGTQDPTRMVSGVRSEVNALDPALPVSNIKTINQMIYERVSPKRLMTYILAVFALCALLLASVGIYGVMSYAVSQRTQEIGIRMALGARTADVLKLVVSNGMKLTLIGVVIGLAGAFALTRFLENLLFHVTPTDRVTFIAVATSLIVVALLASYVPARRATKVDPLVALRDE
ncbi:MAG TPA: ABC transporter permease [Pyrinomonadaceae bacterium]|nr:ABC transporter permease [Pyrinomonadaceae bacterium]